MCIPGDCASRGDVPLIVESDGGLRPDEIIGLPNKGDHRHEEESHEEEQQGKAVFTGAGAVRRRIELGRVLQEGRRALRELVLAQGLRVFAELLEEDRTLLCGPRHAPNPERQAYRHGHDVGALVFGGRKIRAPKRGCAA